MKRKRNLYIGGTLLALLVALEAAQLGPERAAASQGSAGQAPSLPVD